MDIPTRVRITVPRTELYDVELPDKQMLRLLELLMRRYEGVFSYTVSIDEEDLAEKLGETLPGLRQRLYRLSLEHVINYVPADKSDVLFLSHPRLMPGNVALSPNRYRLLKERYGERMEAMIEYAAADQGCRQQRLLAYFGQEKSEPCGHCDLCLARRSSEADLRRRLQEWTDAHPGYTLEMLRDRFASPAAEESPEYLAVLRELIDEGKVPPPIEN